MPWRSAWRIAQLTSAETRFVLAASGHIAGMINPPSKGKGCHWTNETDGAALGRRRRGWPARKSMTAAGGPTGQVARGPIWKEKAGGGCRQRYPPADR